jgi:hypothetical protein
VYDLCAPKRSREFYSLPLRSKPAVAGITLLQCSKQIHNEVSQRLGLWDYRTRWYLRFDLSVSTEHSTNLNFSFNNCGLHNLALAKIKDLKLSFDFAINVNATFSVCGLVELLKLKSLWHVNVFVYLKSDPAGPVIKELSDLEDLPLITGLVIRILSHLPASVTYVGWYINYSCIESSSRYCDFLEKLGEKYKSVQGSAYTVQQKSGSLSQPIEISVSQHFWKEHDSSY